MVVLPHCETPSHSAGHGNFRRDLATCVTDVARSWPSATARHVARLRSVRQQRLCHGPMLTSIVRHRAWSGAGTFGQTVICCVPGWAE